MRAWSMVRIVIVTLPSSEVGVYRNFSIRGMVTVLEGLEPSCMGECQYSCVLACCRHISESFHIDVPILFAVGNFAFHLRNNCLIVSVYLPTGCGWIAVAVRCLTSKYLQKSATNLLIIGLNIAWYAESYVAELQGDADHLRWCLFWRSILITFTWSTCRS